MTDSAIEGTAYIDGAYVPLAEARIPILDRGFVRSDATYDVAHVWKGRFFRLDDHIERFFASMRGLRFELAMGADEIRTVMLECVRRSGLADAYVQITCTRGIPPKGSRDPRECENRFYAFAQPFVWIANDDQRRDGLKLVVSRVRRIPEDSVDPRLKNFHWMDLTRGIFEAYDRNATAAVLVDGAGHLTEGAGFNIFLRHGETLATPDRGVFEGMTRRTVLELCGELGFDAEARPVAADEIAGADEVFITSTAGGVMPVTEVDGRPVGDGRPGPATRALNDLYWQRHEEGWKCTPVRAAA